MTDFSKTITNSIRAFGIGTSTKWGTGMTWGTTKWGEGSTETQTIKFINIGIANTLSSNSDVVRYVMHMIANTQGTTSDLVKIPYKGIANAITTTEDLGERIATKVFDNDQPITTDTAKGVTMGFTSTMICDADLESIKIYDTAGYCDNFPGSKQNGRDRIWDNWTSLTSSTDGFIEATHAATTWSDA